MEKRFVYADNAATTQVSEKVLAAMLPYLKEGYGNPSSIYALGRRSAQAILDARTQVARAIGARLPEADKPSEIYFTSCGSEADNWAIKGAALAQAKKGKKHIVTTAIEHHAVLHTCMALEKDGFEVTYLPVDANGLVTPEQVKAALRPDTALCTIMFANNEIGTIEPIAEIGAVCREAGVWFHTDAVQAVGHVEIDVERMNIDMLSLSGHKIHAPKGVGALYCRRGIAIRNLIDGGGQESNKRAGTENVAFIVGLGAAMEEACRDIPARMAKVAAKRDRLIAGLLQIPHSRLNGHPTRRLAGNCNISFEGVEGESLLLRMDQNGIAASSGSACTSGSLDPSHVLLAIGLSHEVAHGSLRLSIEEETSEEDIDYILAVTPSVVEGLRAMSPLWERLVKENAFQVR